MLEQIVLFVCRMCSTFLKKKKDNEYTGTEILLLFSASSNKDEQDMEYLVFCEHFRSLTVLHHHPTPEYSAL